MTANGVLCAMDLSPHSGSVLRTALRVAAARHAAVHVVHVRPEPHTFDASASSSERAVTQVLRAHVSEAAHDGDTIEQRIAVGVPAEAILREREAVGADVVVVGVHARSQIARWLVGSTATRVLRSSPVDVIAVPGAMTDANAHSTFRSVLCATDFSFAADSALRTAIAIAKEHHAALHLAHVWSAPPSMVAGDAASITTHEHEAHHALETLANRYGADAPTIHRHLRQGAPGETLVQLARDLGIELMVLGSAPKGRLERVLLGSVAEDVVRRAATPVWLVRPEGSLHH